MADPTLEGNDGNKVEESKRKSVLSIGKPSSPASFMERPLWNAEQTQRIPARTAWDFLVLPPARKVKLTVISPQGKEAIVAVLGAGEFFGEGCLAGQPLRMATAVAMTDLHS